MRRCWKLGFSKAMRELHRLQMRFSRFCTPRSMSDIWTRLGPTSLAHRLDLGCESDEATGVCKDFFGGLDFWIQPLLKKRRNILKTCVSIVRCFDRRAFRSCRWITQFVVGLPLILEVSIGRPLCCPFLVCEPARCSAFPHVFWPMMST